MVENNTGNIPGKKSEIDSRARNQRDLYVKKVLPDINRTAKRVWRDTSDIASEDIAQETVVNLFTRKRVKEPQLEIPYAVQATKHTAIDEGRKRAKQVTFPRDNAFLDSEKGEVLFIPNDNSRSAEDQVMDNIGREIIWKAIQKLPRKQREVIVLRDMEGLSEKEAAELLGVTQGTIKSNLFNARKSLRMKLDEAGFERE